VPKEADSIICEPAVKQDLVVLILLEQLYLCDKRVNEENQCLEENQRQSDIYFLIHCFIVSLYQGLSIVLCTAAKNPLLKELYIAL
jgi:hypothetical protein